jgi:hypothetical protein
VYYVEVSISLNETTGAGSNCGSHVGDDKSTVRLGTDFIGNGSQYSSVALQKGGTVRVGGIEVETGVLCHIWLVVFTIKGLVMTDLGLQERKETTTKQGFAIKRGSQMVGIVTTGWNIGHPEKSTEGVLNLIRNGNSKAK